MISLASPLLLDGGPDDDDAARACVREVDLPDVREAGLADERLQDGAGAHERAGVVLDAPADETEVDGVLPVGDRVHFEHEHLVVLVVEAGRLPVRPVVVDARLRRSHPRGCTRTAAGTQTSMVSHLTSSTGRPAHAPAASYSESPLPRSPVPRCLRRGRAAGPCRWRWRTACSSPQPRSPARGRRRCGRPRRRTTSPWAALRPP